VKVVWRLGLIEKVEINDVGDWFPKGHQLTEWHWSPFRLHPIHTIRLRDWHGIERSLPRDPDALPWLARLYLPHYSHWPVGVVEEGSIGYIQQHFGRIGGTVCEACGGTGRDQRESTYGDCPTCRGSGTVGDEWRVSVEFA